MKTLCIFLLLVVSSTLRAEPILDTLYANNTKNVALFFPEAIRQGITGANHFVFSYNRETKQYFGLLQAQPGEESNLLVITEGGHVYSYIIKYADALPKLNYFITESESIGSETPATKMNPPKPEPVDSAQKDEAYFKSFSQYVLKTKPKTQVSKKKHGMRINIQNMIYHKSETYLAMELSNSSGIPFDTNFLKIYTVRGNNKRKASYQRLELHPVYIHNKPTTVWNGQSLRFVYVLPKYVLGDNEKFIIELQESNGGRKVILTHKLKPL